MEFMTQVQIPVQKDGITYKNKILLLGSCFADEIGGYLQDYRFRVMVNPFGTLYNPVSIANSLERLAAGTEFTEQDIVTCNRICTSFYHHSSIYGLSAGEFLTKANAALQESIRFFREADTLIITLGTAYIYKHITRNIIVSNCHKVKPSEFERKLLTPQECTGELKRIVKSLEKKAGSVPRKIIFTVSPIRHLKDGAHGNQISKSTLLLGTENLLNNISAETPGKNESITLHYFPSYEIMMDELRDYRFYDTDMLHPTGTAVEYIFERFKAAFIDRSCDSLLKEAIRLTKAMKHRPLFPESSEYEQFRKKLEQDLETFNKKTDTCQEKRY